MDGYLEMTGFPNCGGAVDGTHIPVITPSDHHADYVNRKGWYSIIMQAACNHKYVFTDVNIGWPGLVHNVGVLANSRIFREGEQGTLFGPLPQPLEIEYEEVPIVLLGDPAYPLKPWLQKPFSDGGNLSAEQFYFNYRLTLSSLSQ